MHVSAICLVCVVSSSKYSIVNDKYSRWDRHNQGKKNKRGVLSMELGFFRILGILLYGVLCLMSTAGRQVEGEETKGGRVVGRPATWGQLDFQRFALMLLVPKRKECFLSAFLGV